MYKGDVYNPSQNININISYNLNTDKLPKSLFGKKISKINKLSNQKISPQIELKLQKKNIQNMQKKSNEIKKSSLQGKKPKKKENKQLIRNTISPQLCIQRKLKTEGSYPEQMTSTFKKQNKLKKSGHLKSIQTNFIPSNNKSLPSKKIMSQSKTPKNSKKMKQSHNKSCMLYSTKKQLINLQSNLEGAQHIISTCLAAPQRKRIQSAITFKNDKKIVSKFLNMSMISSQLGGSQLISSQRLRQSDGKNSQPHRALKQYLNSIDMRIMKNIQQDVNIVNENKLKYLFSQKPIISNGKQTLIKELLKIKKISFEEFERKVIIIQRKFRKLKKKSVLSFYKEIFLKVSQFENDQFGRHFSKISPEKQFQLEHKYNNSIQISKQIQNLRKQKFQINESQNNQGQIKFDKEFKIDQISDINENSRRQNDTSQEEIQMNLHFVENKFNQTQKIKKSEDNLRQQIDMPPSLNFQRYKQLVENQIKQNKKKHNVNFEINRQHLSKFKEQQIQQWNSINKLISSNMRQKSSPLSSNQLLDKLIQQSKLNKQWIQQQISANQTLNNSHQNSVDQNTQKGNNQMNKFNQQVQLYAQQEDNESQQQNNHVIEGQVQDSLTMIQEYDSKKYSLNLQYENNENSSCEGSPSLKFNKSSLFDKQIELDRRWINRQLQLLDKQTQKNESYLDCSLNGFGINLNNYPKKEEKKQKQQKNQIVTEDKDKINDFIYEPECEELSDFVKQDSSLHVSAQSSVSGQEQLLPDSQGYNQTEKNINQQIKKKKLVRIIEDIILDLIRQFAYDISTILKKNSGISINKNQNQNPQVVNIPVQQQKPKVLGVNTSYASVKDYLSQFKNYILSSQQTKKKIMNNINKDIGPNSLQILSYLRPEASQISIEQTNQGQPSNIQQDQNLQDEEGLFVVPSETFEQFQDFLQIQQSKIQTIQLTTRQKAYLNFWHRSVFQSFNQYLDYQRPYGITGKPYDWISERKKPKIIPKQLLQKSLQKAIDKLLQSMMFLSGLIFQKMDSPFTFVDEQNRQMINEQRLSRMLATQLFESQQSWINYNDESAQLQVQLSRMIQQKIFFQVSSQLKRIGRKRKLLVQQSGNFKQQKIQFQYQQI